MEIGLNYRPLKDAGFCPLCAAQRTHYNWPFDIALASREGQVAETGSSIGGKSVERTLCHWAES